MPKDKLKSSYTKDELESYLLHERGHVNFLGRIMTGVYALIMTFTALFFYLVILFIDRQKYDLMKSMIFYILIFFFLGWLLNMLREYYADYYAWKHCGKKHLISALVKIDKYKRRTMFQSLLRNYTHPSLKSRIKLIEFTRN